MDIILCILPKLEPIAPTVGPAVLKSHCQAAGFTCQLRDLNIELYRYVSEEDREAWTTDDKIFVNEVRWRHFYENKCKDLFERWAEQLVAARPRWIGLSVFSVYSKLAAIELIKLIKGLNPDQKMVVGGAGVYKDIDTWPRIGVDHWIVGDAEESIVKLLQGKLDDPGINNRTPNQVADLDSVLLPDYDDINQDLYENRHFRTTYITSSRGCIRDCTFCDVATMWPKFRFRSSEHVVNEIISSRQRYGFQDFYFTDSLINGGLKNFRQLCNSLARYREETGDVDFECGGQFICRNRSQFTPDDFDLMRAAGFEWVAIGIESASESVRDHMRKGFTNEDMLYTFEQCKRVGLRMTLLFIVGYPTETRADFEETLDLIRSLADQGYFEGPKPIVSKVNFFDQVLFPMTPIYDMHASLGVVDAASPRWKLGNNNNLRVRIVRMAQAYQTLERYAGGQTHWITKNITRNLKNTYRDLTGLDLPEDIMSYDERLEYDSN